MNKEKYNNRLFSYTFYYSTTLLLVLAGLADSVYLSIHHYLVYTDIGYESFCAVSKTINCDTVSQSPYAVFLGIPVAVWGVFGYCLCLIFLSFALHKDSGKKRIWPLMFSVASAFSLISIYFAILSNYYIRSYCIMCIVVYGINFLLSFNSWLIIKRFGENEGFIKGIRDDINFILNKKRYSLSIFVPCAAIVVSVFLFFPVYWNFQMPALSANIPKGVSSEGHPWIGGAHNPELVITEYSDYLCFQCRKMHFFLRHLVDKNPEKIRLIHRHYPMDHNFNPIVKEPFHVGSGEMALLAVYASSKGKFWEINDYLFSMDKSRKSVDIRELAKKTGLDFRELAMARYDNGVRQALWKDIRDGLQLKITGTPGYVIDDKLYLGEIPADILKKVIE